MCEKLSYQIINASHPAFTCSKLTIERLEQRCEIRSKLTKKPPKRRHYRCFSGFIVNFEHISHLCSSVSIVNFEHVIAGWVQLLMKLSFVIIRSLQKSL